MSAGVHELAFTLTLDDAVAFANYHTSHSPAIARTRRRLQVILGTLLSVVGLIILVTGGEVARAMIYFGLGAVWFVLWPPFQRWATRREVLKSYGEGTNRTFIGPHRLQVQPDGLSWSSEHSEGKYKWSGVERIATTPDYTYVYVAAIMAVIIPRCSVTAGDYESFVRAVGDATASQRGPVDEKSP